MCELKKLSRRHFLSDLSALLGGTAVLTGSPLAVSADSRQHSGSEANSVPASKGYQHTKHVDTYYQLADL